MTHGEHVSHFAVIFVLVAASSFGFLEIVFKGANMGNNMQTSLTQATAVQSGSGGPE
jgi:thiol:disulfide interchange protein